MSACLKGESSTMFTWHCSAWLLRAELLHAVEVGARTETHARTAYNSRDSVEWGLVDGQIRHQTDTNRSKSEGKAKEEVTSLSGDW